MSLTRNARIALLAAGATVIALVVAAVAFRGDEPRPEGAARTEAMAGMDMGGGSRGGGMEGMEMQGRGEEGLDEKGADMKAMPLP